MRAVKKAAIKLMYLVLLFFFIFPLPVNAAGDFEIINSYDVDYRKGDDFITITESIEFIVYTQDYYIPAGTEQTFLLQDYGTEKIANERAFKTNSLRVITQYGTQLNYDKTTTQDGIEISVPLTLRVDYRNTYKIIIQYKTHELVNANGNVVNLYVPGLNKNTKFTEKNGALTTKYVYKASVTTDKTLPAPSYLQPSTITKTARQDEMVYSIPQQDRLGHTSWLQLGSSQYYYFKIVQNTPKTDNLIPPNISKIAPVISSNVFKLALPREFDENQQKVYFKNITPAPQLIERDSEGNLIATFSVPANEQSQIVIEGYISLFNPSNGDKNTPGDMSLSAYSEQIGEIEGMSTYLQKDKYWETDSQAVKTAASELLTGETELLSLIKKDYNYVVDKLTYDNAKISSGNPRLGAQAALTGSETICMEYADSLIAILRAQGIASRAALGYGNDPTGAENRISNEKPLKQTIGHQWVQIWVPDYGWLSVDPTWGESERTYIGSDLDHILWYTVGDNNQAVTDTVAYISDPAGSDDLREYEVYIQALNESQKETITSYDTSGNIIDKYRGDNLTGASLFLQTTPFGRVIIFLIPITAIIIISMFFSLFLKFLHRRLLAKKSLS